MSGSVGAVSMGAGAASAAASVSPAIGGAPGLSALNSVDASAAGPSSIVTLSGAPHTSSPDGPTTGSTNGPLSAYRDVHALGSPVSAYAESSFGDERSMSAGHVCCASSTGGVTDPAMRALDSLADLLIMLLVIQMMDAINGAQASA
jgi:hypothetical protein